MKQHVTIHFVLHVTLHAVVGTIKTSLQNKEYALAAFLETEGTFNNVKIESI